jgi:ubiquinone biosynthesis protein
MLDPKMIPTRLVEPAEVKPVVIKVPNRPSRFHLLYLTAFFLRCYLGVLWLWVRRRLTREEHARRLRLAFEHLGGVWIKLGQLLSLRTDVFSREFCVELARLQAQAEGFPPEMARQIIEAELGGPVETYFEEYEAHPFAAASIGQVHRAKLRQEGVEVAIKVQRPYSAEAAVREMAFVRFLVRIIERLWFMPNLQWQELLWELNQILAEEIDYRYEASSIMRLRKSLRKHKVYVHKVFNAYSTRRVLVTEYISAVLMADYIRVVKTEPLRCEKWHQENNIDPKLVARRLFDSLWRQLLQENLFHGDMHPGNIILLRDSQLSLIDFGAVGSMEHEYQHKFFLMMQAMASLDYAKAADCLLLLSGALPPTDLTETKQKLIRCLRSWEQRSYAKGLPYHEKSMSSLVNELVKILFQYECAADWSFLRITRAQETVDQSLMHLNPKANYVKLMRGFFRRAQQRDRKRAQQPEEIRNYVLSLLDLVKIPQRLSENAMFQSWILRRQAQSFRGSTSKLAQFFAVLCGRGAVLVLLGLGYLFLVFLRQHHADSELSLKAENWLGDELASFPYYLTYLFWVLILLVVLNLGVTLWALKRRFSRKERASLNNNNS